MDGDFIALFHNVDDACQIGEVNPGIDSLGVEVQRQGDEVDIPCSLAVSKETAFNSICPCHLSELRRCNRTSPVIVWMNRDADLLPLRHVGAEELDLIGVDVWSRHLHGGGKIKDELVLHGRFPGGLDRFTDFDDKVWIGVGEGLRTELKCPFRATLRRVILGDGSRQLRAFNGKLDALLSGMAKDDALEAFACREVDMKKCLFRTSDGIDGPPDEVFPTG
jgi:hypothetical protein